MSVWHTSATAVCFKVRSWGSHRFRTDGLVWRWGHRLGVRGSSCCARTFPLYFSLWYLSWGDTSFPCLWLLLPCFLPSHWLLPWGFLFCGFIFPTAAYLRKLCLPSGRSHPTLSRLLTFKRSSRALPFTLTSTLFFLQSFTLSYALSSALGYYLIPL